MGRKSIRKKGRLELRDEIKKGQRRQNLISYLILFSGSALFIWGISLFNKTFIETQTQVYITLFGATIGTLVLYFLGRRKSYDLLVTLFLGFYLGGSIPFCLMATTNYYLRNNEKQILQLNIIQTGNHSRRKSKCRRPYAIVEFQNIKKEIKFPCEYETSISNYKSVTLTTSKGVWGYEVFTDKKLND